MTPHTATLHTLGSGSREIRLHGDDCPVCREAWSIERALTKIEAQLCDLEAGRLRVAPLSLTRHVRPIGWLRRLWRWL